jgi:hypothetical protein
MKTNFAATSMISVILTPALAVSASSVLQYVSLVLAFAALLWGTTLVLQHKDMRSSYHLLVISAGIACFYPLLFSSMNSQILITSLICDFFGAIWLRRFEIKHWGEWSPNP